MSSACGAPDAKTSTRCMMLSTIMRAGRRRRSSIAVSSLSSPNSPPSPVLASVTPSVYSNDRSPGDNTVALMRFLPGNLVIHNGDTITWTDEDPETPHTVSFLQGNALPDVALPVNQASGPPLLIFNPLVLLPHGGDIFDGSGTATTEIRFVW